MKTLLLTTTLLFSAASLAQSEAQERHEEACASCHVIEHDDDFYTRENTRMKTYADLRRQVSMCVSAFGVDWFPEEEAGEVKFLNDKYYKLQEN